MNDYEKIAAEAAETSKKATEWLTVTQKLHDMAAFVLQTKQSSDQLLSIFEKAPHAGISGNFSGIYSNIHHAKVLISQSTPHLPGTWHSALVSGSASAVSAINLVTLDLNSALNNKEEPVRKWAQDSLQPLQESQSEKLHLNFIRRKLSILHTKALDEFTGSIAEYQKFKVKLAQAIAVGIAMRNVLETVNGDLLELGRKYQPRAQIKKWNDAASIIARSDPASIGITKLVSQKTVYDSLHGQLTKVLKNDLTPTELEWSQLYGQYLGFLFAVLGLVDFRDGE